MSSSLRGRLGDHKDNLVHDPANAPKIITELLESPPTLGESPTLGEFPTLGELPTLGESPTLGELRPRPLDNPVYPIANLPCQTPAQIDYISH